VPRHLQVLLGRERGRVYAVDTVDRGSYVVGRGSDCDIVLASDIVSRRHAQLTASHADLRVTDLGSSNGTFINGARVLGDGTVKPDDILIVGEVALRLHPAQPPTLQPVGDYPAPPNTTSTPLVNLAGNLTEVPPATLLRHLAVLKKSGVLLLTSPPLQGRITLNRGHISAVLVDTRKTRDPVQALTAILRWRGTFELGPARPDADSSSLLLGLDVVVPPVGSSSRASTPKA
jgi:predicted component of type VI protein secretion system